MKMRCPRCDTFVDDEPGWEPVCPTCGFVAAGSSGTPPPAPGPAPAQGSGGISGGAIALIVVGVACGLVLITVVGAALVFVLVSDLGDGPGSAPHMSFHMDPGQDHLILMAADPEADWADIRVSWQGDCTVSLSTRDGDHRLLNGGRARPVSQPAEPGDRFKLDVGGTACRLSLVHVPSDSLYDEWTFS